MLKVQMTLKCIQIIIVCVFFYPLLRLDVLVCIFVSCPTTAHNMLNANINYTTTVQLDFEN